MLRNLMGVIAKLILKIWGRAVQAAPYKTIVSDILQWRPLICLNLKQDGEKCNTQHVLQYMQ